MSLGSGLWVSVSLRPRALVDFVDVTLADDDTNSILADDANLKQSLSICYQYHVCKSH